MDMQAMIDELRRALDEQRERIVAIKSLAAEAQEILGKTRDHESPDYVCEAHNLLDDIGEM